MEVPLIKFKKLLFSIIAITTIFLSRYSIAQTVVTEIKKYEINTKIALAVREQFPDFKQILENYINNGDWTKEEIDVEIPINIELFFNSATHGAEDIYNVNILISDNSDIQYFDQRCRFRFQRGSNLQFSHSNWNSLTSLIDFYIYLLLGDEIDKLGHLLGTPYYEKARQIAQQANFLDARFYFGWEQRNELIQEILSDQNLKFREMKDFYFYGLYYAKEDPSKAQQYCSAAIEMIEEIYEQTPKHERCKRFLSAHYIEIIDIFKDSRNIQIFDKLIKIDPDHASVYKNHIR